MNPETKEWDGRGSPLDYVVSKNLHRRHLSEAQRATVGAKIANMREGHQPANASIEAFEQFTWLDSYSPGPQVSA